jgi:hypothetical protein
MCPSFLATQALVDAALLGSLLTARVLSRK